MDIEFLGHSSFLIKGKNASIITDPYDSTMVGLKFPKVMADIVTVSHDHGDHNHVEAVSDVRKIIAGPGEYEVGGVSFIGIQSYHDDKKGKERGKNVIFVIEVDGFRIVHLGDLGHKLSDKKIDAIGEVDILMIPIGGIYTIDAKTAAGVVKALGPRAIIPMHYKMAGLNSKAFGELTGVDAFTSELEIKTEKLSKLKLKSIRDLPEEDQIVYILELKK